MTREVSSGSVPALVLAVSLGASAPAALAMEASAATPTDARIEEVRVFAHSLRPTSREVAQPVSVLSGEALARRVAPSLGATVDSEPGIHSSYFGPAVGRPVIRGLSGPRVKLLEDGIAAMDVSTTSDDHATSVEPFLAEQIEILKGPATVLYGSGAIGGVVNSVSGRIPQAAPEKAMSLKAEARVGDVADESSLAVRADGGSEQFAWHLDALSRQTDDFDVPGFVESEALRDAEAAEAAETGGDAPEEARGSLPNSDLDTEVLSAGFAWFGERVQIGAAVSRYQNEYGLPGGHPHEEAHEEEHEAEEEEEEGDVRIELDQTRYDLQIGVAEPLPGFDALRLRGAFNDYRHVEIEGSGEVGTLFENESVEARLELLNAPIAGFTGAVGLQVEDRDFRATGEEAFVVPVQRDAQALFVYQQRQFVVGGVDLGLDLGLRGERVAYDPDAGRDTDFDAFSFALGGVWALTDDISLALQTDIARRAPELEELYANGPHLATRTFEIGRADLDEEQALNATLTLDASFEWFETVVSVYRTDFSDFIHLRDTGLEEEGLPVRVWTQGDARVSGAEAELIVHVLESATTVDLRVVGDLVRARLENPPAGEDADLPRIPAGRLGLGLEFTRGSLAGEIGVTRVFRQTDTAAFETATDAYTMVDVFLGWHLNTGRGHVELFLQGDNLLDVEARAHTSFLKDFAPLPGRSLQAGVRLEF
ncbi:MAG TPA: TonB-dependent receptor [Pseudomonadales bacterium]|nr:TonB-dependent receptor [Pseudomonadales bacterium]